MGVDKAVVRNIIAIVGLTGYGVVLAIARCGINWEPAGCGPLAARERPDSTIDKASLTLHLGMCTAHPLHRNTTRLLFQQFFPKKKKQ